MIEIDGVLISEEAFNLRFQCDLSRCKGNCCRYGDRGSPIDRDEEENIKNTLPFLENLLPPKYFSALQTGIAERDKGKLYIRELGSDVPCPLSHAASEGTIFCALHTLALETGAPVSSLKPLWCRFFPLVIRKNLNGYLINVILTEQCKNIANPPLILFSYAQYLEEIFGIDWTTKLLKLLPR